MYERRPGFFRTEDAPTGRRVEAKVKWFDSAKGFGFVTPNDGTPDAFLPMAVLRRARFENVREGATVTCDVASGAKGPLVLEVIAIDDSTTAPAPRARVLSSVVADHGGARHGAPDRKMDGAVKWFEANKGFGFVTPDGGGKDIFIHVTALRRSGVPALETGQRVRVDVVDGPKGLEADRVTPI